MDRGTRDNNAPWFLSSTLDISEFYTESDLILKVNKHDSGAVQKAKKKMLGKGMQQVHLISMLPWACFGLFFPTTL